MNKDEAKLKAGYIIESFYKVFPIKSILTGKEDRSKAIKGAAVCQQRIIAKLLSYGIVSEFEDEVLKQIKKWN